MLIEYLGVGRFNPTYNGRTYMFEPLPQYGNARVCDMQDPAFVARILSYKDGNGNLQCRRYPLDALQDPDLKRLVYRNPAATLAILEDFLLLLHEGKADDLDIDEESVHRELIQKSVEDLRILAADMGIMTHPQVAHHVCLSFIMPHVMREFVRAFEEPVVKPKPEPEPEKEPEPVEPAPPAPPDGQPVSVAVQVPVNAAKNRPMRIVLPSVSRNKGGRPKGSGKKK